MTTTAEPYPRTIAQHPRSAAKGDTFTGQYSCHVTDFGLMFYNARWLRSAPVAQRKGYDPQLGRFAQADSIIPTHQGTQAWDRYAYVSNNPLKYQDPTGHGAYCGDDYDPGCQNNREYLQYLQATDNLPDGMIIPNKVPDNIRNRQVLEAWLWLYNTDSGRQAAILVRNLNVTVEINPDRADPVTKYTADGVLLGIELVPGRHSGNLQTQDLAGQLAHEAYHVGMGPVADTQLEEYYAFEKQADVIYEIGHVKYWTYPYSVGLNELGFEAVNGGTVQAIGGNPTGSPRNLRRWIEKYHEKYRDLPVGIQ